MNIEQENKVLELYKGGKTVSQISEETGLKLRVISSSLNKHGLIRSLNKFSPETEREIASLYKAGMRTSELQRKFGSTVATITKIIKRQGIELASNERKSNSLKSMHLRKVSPEQEAHIISLWEEGLSIQKISKATGLGRKTVHNCLLRNGCTRTNHRFSPEVEEEIVSLYQQGMSLNQLQKRFECSNWTTFCNILKRHGIERRNRGAAIHELADEEKASVLDRWIMGESISKICQELKLSYDATRNWMVRQGAGLEKRYNSGERHGMWKGGRRVLNGYVVVILDRNSPFYCMSLSNGYVMEHRLVMAQHLGRPLDKEEGVHHINGDRTDNRLENLQLVKKYHGSGQCWKCADCGSQNIIPVEM